MPFVKVRGDGAITIPVELRRKHSVTRAHGIRYQLQAKGKSCCPLSARCAPSVVRKFYPLMP